MTIDQNLTTALTLPVLKKCDPIRLEKAILGLLDQSLTITLTHQEQGRIYAIASNGDGIKYDVALTAAGVSCTCSDFTYRKTICKHLIGACLSASHAARQAPAPTHLRWRSGEILCGAPTSEKAHTWPWPGTLVQWEETCASCRTTYQQGYNRTQHARKAEEIARRSQGSFQEVAPGTPQSSHRLAPNLKDKSLAA